MWLEEAFELVIRFPLTTVVIVTSLVSGIGLAIKKYRK